VSYEFGNVEDLRLKLQEIYENPDRIINMKANCIAKAEKFKSEEVIKIMLNAIESKGNE
jgi:hypothetical protein